MQIYDQFGKEGLQPGSGPAPRASRPRHGHHYDFDFHSGFEFRDPEDVFREFFGSDPFTDLMGFDPFEGFGPHCNRRRRQGRHRGSVHGSAPYQTVSNFFGPGFGLSFSFPFDDFGGGLDRGGGFTSFTSQSFSPGVGGGFHGKRTSTSTKYVNGKKVSTKKVVENGVETVIVTENDVIKSKTVNGVPQALSY